MRESGLLTPMLEMAEESKSGLTEVDTMDSGRTTGPMGSED